MRNLVCNPYRRKGEEFRDLAQFCAHINAALVNPIPRSSSSPNEFLGANVFALDAEICFSVYSSFNNGSLIIPIFGFLDGPNKGQTFTKEELERDKDLYYEMMGWDKENGKPTRGKLIELNIEYPAE